MRMSLVWVLVAGVVLAATDAGAQVMPRPPRKGAKYKVTIDSSPQQAAIYLDDKQYGIVGYTPYRGTLVKGGYKLILELPGFKPLERPINIARGKNDLFFPLEKKEMPGTIDVQGTADPNVTGAQVFIDGQAKGTVPQSIEVPKGRHLLEIKKDKFNDFAQWVDVQEGQRVTLAPSLKTNAKGSLLVDADVRGATVSVDGKRQTETAPVLIDDLDEGQHVIEVSKPPAVPWKQTVYVKPGERTKITAELQASVQQAEGGNIRVIVNVEDATVWVDGMNKGKQPVDVTGLQPGQHIVEARAENYDPKEERVTVNAGSATVVKLDLQPGTGIRGPAGKIKVVTPVPEATVFIDGASVGFAPLEKEVAAGEHYISVERQGYAKFEQKINVEAKKTFTVTAELKAVGTVKFMSTPEAAEVFIDGERVGRTPLVKEDVPVGDHLVSFRLENFRDFDQSVKVDGGRTAIINAPLRNVEALTGPELERVVRGLSSYGAATVPGGRFTADVSVGYPYWVEARLTTGIPGIKPLAADVSFAFRTLLTTWEFLAAAKVRFVHVDPFSLAAFVTGGGGAGASGRNEFTFQAGAIGSLSFADRATISARVYLDAWSDRLCKEPDKGMQFPTSGPDVCQGPTVAGVQDFEKAQGIHGEDDLSTRDSGARVYLSLVAEIAATERINVFAVFEGAAFQDQRAAHSGLFTGSLISDDDPIYNGRLGLTFKF